jgi:hypothetical protein
MEHIINHSIKDTLTIIPFLFIAFLFMEYIEHKFNKKTKNIIERAGKSGPLLGSILGVFPQCGFSVMGTNFYAARIISLGTLISIYLSTSDEMLPIMLSEGLKLSQIFYILFIKVVIAIIAGFIIDYIYRNKKVTKKVIHELCEEEHCDCHHDGIIKSSIKHTLSIVLFIFITNLIITGLIETIGEDNMSEILFKNTIFGPFIASLFGLIPNCASSVIITELFLSGAISFGSLIAGLLTGSGIAILVLFKINKNLKENFHILGLVYFVGVISGIIIELITLW